MKAWKTLTRALKERRREAGHFLATGGMKAQFEWNEEKMEHEAERAGTDKFFKEYQKKRVEPGDSVEQKTTHL